MCGYKAEVTEINGIVKNQKYCMCSVRIKKINCRLLI